MELTQETVNNPLTQLGPADGYIYLTNDLDRQDLTDLLCSRYGAPRTLVLDGFTDPTVDEPRGAALLVPFEDRAVTIRAWAYGDQWVGTGTARDAVGPSGRCWWSLTGRCQNPWRSLRARRRTSTGWSGSYG